MLTISYISFAIDFPFFDFSKYIIPDDNQLINLESELIKELIEEEKNIV